MQSVNHNARVAGHVLAIVIAVAALISGVAALTTTLPKVVGVTLLVTGVVVPVLVWRSLAYSRGAWSFLIATLVVYPTTTFFGAPKIGHVLGIGLGYSFLVPALMACALSALIMVRADYRAR